MTKDEFRETYLEGGILTDKLKLLGFTIDGLYDAREQVKHLQELIEFMNDVARDCDWSMKCRSCGDDYTPDCELSEMFGAENYCGKNQWCCP